MSFHFWHFEKIKCHFFVHFTQKMTEKTKSSLGHGQNKALFGSFIVFFGRLHRVQHNASCPSRHYRAGNYMYHRDRYRNSPRDKYRLGRICRKSLLIALNETVHTVIKSDSGNERNYTGEDKHGRRFFINTRTDLGRKGNKDRRKKIREYFSAEIYKYQTVQNVCKSADERRCGHRFRRRRGLPCMRGRRQWRSLQRGLQCQMLQRKPLRPP